jgi:malic enzyme
LTTRGIILTFVLSITQGSAEPRLEGEEHFAVVEEFCLAVADKWPNCLIQFEDFKTEDAFRVLERMQERVLCFNDDIQGTGATVLAGLINALRAQGTAVRDVRIIFFGAGSSAIGVATQIVQLLMSEGLEEDEATARVHMFDSKGLVTDQRFDWEQVQTTHKVKFAQRGVETCDDLLTLIQRVHPHALFGLSGFGPVFTKEHIDELCRHVGRPIVFPLSNPTTKAEITAVDAYTWSNGKCLFAAGSPFEPVKLNGVTHVPGQGNNMFIFPGIGFAAVSVKAKYVPDSFFVVAAKALAAVVPDDEVQIGTIYPNVSDIREISTRIAVAVAQHAYEIGVAQLYPKPGDLLAFIQGRMYYPMKYDR